MRHGWRELLPSLVIRFFLSPFNSRHQATHTLNSRCGSPSRTFLNSSILFTRISGPQILLDFYLKMETRSYASGLASTRNSTLDNTREVSNSRTHTGRDTDSHLSLGQRSRHSRPDRMPHGPRHASRHDTREGHRSQSRLSASHHNSPDLPNRVGDLEDGMYTVNEKLDKILRHLPVDRSQRVRHSTVAAPAPVPTQAPPAPSPTYYDFEAELRKAEPQFTTDKGKDPIKDFFVGDILPRPYMFIDRPGVRTQKEKAAMRETMSFNDYVIGFTTMLLDKRVTDPQDWHHLITHLNQVSKDAHERPWGGVRNWSDAVFTAIERADITWQDKASIQFDRMRFSLAPPQTPNNYSQKPQNSTKEIPCPEYNAKRCHKCRPKDAHYEQAIRMMHVCSYCLATTTQRLPHTLVDCDRKLRDAGVYTHNDVHQPNRPQQPQPHFVANYQQPQKRQVFTTAYVTNQNRQSKNDQQAHVAQPAAWDKA